MKINKLITKAKNLRIKTFLAFVQKGEAHLGGSFSMIEILISLYENIMKKKDIFVLSKSHASFPLCILLNEKGFKTKLKTHLELDPKNGINCTTGSLGHGLPIATGMAFAKLKKKEKGKVYVLISDGECQEGTTWESLLIASKHKLSNLVILIDYNKIQALTKLKDGLPLNNLKKKNNTNKPKVIIFNTIKGKGIKSFESDPVWHARQLKGNEIAIGKKALGII